MKKQRRSAQTNFAILSELLTEKGKTWMPVGNSGLKLANAFSVRLLVPSNQVAPKTELPHKRN